MIVVGNTPLNGKRSESADNWNAMLRAACETLRRASSHDSAAVTVVGRASSSADEAQWLLDLAQELADHYGFQVEVRSSKALPSVRFSRGSIAPLPGGGNR